MSNNFLEFINKDIDGKKELIGTLPVKTKVNKKKYNESLDKIAKKYLGYKENVFKYITVKAKSLIKLKDEDDCTDIIEYIDQLEGAKNLLNPFNSCVEKMGFDSLLYQLNCCYTLNFKSLNCIINGMLDKFELAGIYLNSDDFNYTCYVNQYMASFLEVRLKDDKDYSKISEIFEQIYWLNPELIQHIDLNFRRLIREYDKDFNNYLNKLKKEVMKKLDVSSYDVCLKKLEEAYVELNFKQKETVDDVVRLCIDGSVSVEHFDGDNKIRKAAFQSLLGEFDTENKTKFNRVCDDLDKLRLNLLELSSYLTFLPVFETFRDKFKKLAENNSKTDNKDLVSIENKIIKNEKELDKLNEKINGKKSLFSKSLSEVQIKNLKIESVLKAKELYDLYKEYENLYFENNVGKIISANLSVADLLKLFDSYDYFKKLYMFNVFELETLDEVLEYADKFDSFASNALNNIMEGTPIFNDYEIEKVICNKYRLCGISIEEDSLSLENINALLNKIYVVLRCNIIDNSNVPLNKIWFVTKVNEYKEEKAQK